MKETSTLSTTKRRPFIALIDNDLLEEIREISQKSRFSSAHFLRESIVRNLALYKQKETFL